MLDPWLVQSQRCWWFVFPPVFPFASILKYCQAKTKNLFQSPQGVADLDFTFFTQKVKRLTQREENFLKNVPQLSESV